VYNSIFILVADALFVPARIAAWTDSIVIERLLYVVLASTATLTMAWLSWHHPREALPQAQGPL